MAKEYDMVPGATLALGLQKAALQSYVQRYTGTHVPAWTRTAAPNGNFYAPQYKDDAEWLEKTLFPVVFKKGGMQLASGNDVHCQSNTPSFPWGNWLDAPFVRGTPVPADSMLPTIN